MKRFANGRSRLLSLVLSLVLLASLMPVIGLPASAENDNIKNISISNPAFYDDGSLKSMEISFYVRNSEGAAETVKQGKAYGKFALHRGTSTTTYHWGNPYTIGADYDNQIWPNLKDADQSIVAVDSNSFRWTEAQKTRNESVTFEQGKVKPGSVYNLYMWSFGWCGGAYPDCFFASITVGDKQCTYDYTTPAPAPTHAWDPNPVTTGNGTKEAVTTVTCSCGTQVRVSLTASDVTLPGDAFNAEITVEETQKEVAAAYGLRAARSVAPAGHWLKISDTPGYKYSPDGTNFTDIDPNTSPKAGFYQASILVKDANGNQLENLYVNYTVTDPAVTAATGDNRPIELMVMGMALFSALAIAAFVLDGRRRGSR